MRPSGGIIREHQGALLPDEAIKLVRYSLRREQDAVFVVKREQAAIEQPVRGSSQGDANSLGVRFVF